MKKRHGTQRVSKIALEVMEEEKSESIGWGKYIELHEVFDRAGLKLKNKHPLNVQAAVLNALDRESKQENALLKKHYLRVYSGNKERLVRLFLKRGTK